MHVSLSCLGSMPIFLPTFYDEGSTMSPRDCESTFRWLNFHISCGTIKQKYMALFLYHTSSQRQGITGRSSRAALISHGVNSNSEFTSIYPRTETASTYPSGITDISMLTPSLPVYAFLPFQRQEDGHFSPHDAFADIRCRLHTTFSLSRVA